MDIKMKKDAMTYKVCYEAAAVATNDRILGEELDESFVEGFNSTAKEEGQYPGHLIALRFGHVTVDDLQFGARKRCFVTFTVEVEATSEAQAKAYPVPVALLTRLADILGRVDNNHCALELFPGWRVLYAEQETEDLLV